MDPVCHTLVGAALAESGLGRKTRLGTATLVLGANAPDIDVLSYLWGPTTALWFRRGITHGVLGIVVLPLLLTGIMLLWDRLRRRRALDPIRPRRILALAYLAVLTHPALDFLNVYGMRWLMPFSGKWTYGDTLFIVDPWVWALLAGGIFVAYRARTGNSENRPIRLNGASVALIGLLLYVAAMGTSNVIVRRIVTAELEDRGIRPTRLMAAPVPVNPLVRNIVVDDGSTYRFGRFSWLDDHRLTLNQLSYPKFPASPAAAAAVRGPTPRKFLSWARFPYERIEERPGGRVVHIGDARYTLDPEDSWAAISVPVGAR